MSLIFSALKTMEDAEAGAPDLLHPAPPQARLGWWHLLGVMGGIAVLVGGAGIWYLSSFDTSVPASTAISSGSNGDMTVASTDRSSSKPESGTPVSPEQSSSETAPVTSTVSTTRSTMTMTRMPKLAALPSHPAEPSDADQMPPRLAAMPSIKSQTKARTVRVATVSTAREKPAPTMATASPEPIRVAVKPWPKPVRVDTVVAAPTPTLVRTRVSETHSNQSAPKPQRVALVETAAPAKPVSATPDTVDEQSQDSDATQSDPAAVAAANKEIVARRQLSFHVSMLMDDFQAAIASGKPAEAKQKLEALEQIAAPDSLTLLRARAYWALTQGEMDKAMDRYRAILQRVPDDRDAMLNLAVAEWQAGQKSDALARIETLSRRFPDDTTVQRYLRVMEGR